MNRILLKALFGAAAAMAVAAPAYADLGETIGVQGRLLSAGGAPVPDGDYGMTLSFYKNKLDDKAVYVDVKAAVKVSGGMFSLQVGGSTPLNTAVFKAADAAWVGLQVGSDAELPRVPLQYVPYAIRAMMALDLQCSGCVQPAHLAAEVLKPYAKTGDLAAVALSGSYKDLKNTPTGADFAVANQACTPGSMVTGLDGSGKVVCAPPPAYSGKDFALASQACTTGSLVTGIGADGKVQCAVGVSYSGKDFATSGQACQAGSVVSGIGADGKVTCSAENFAIANQGCKVGEVVSAIAADGKLTCVPVVTYSGKDFALSNKSCGNGNLMFGINADGTPNCVADTTYSGKDFALSNKLCSAGNLMFGINADGTPNCVAAPSYKNGTGLTLTNGTFAVDAAWADGQYVNEGQVDAVTAAMVKDGAIGTAELADGAVTAAKIGGFCKDGETLQSVSGKWTCASSAMLGATAANLAQNPALSDFDNNNVPDNVAVDATAGNQKYAKLLVADVNAALGTSLVHEAINTWGVDLRSTGDGTSESMTLFAKIAPAQEPNVWVTCSTYVRRPDGTGTNAKVKLDCFGASASLVIPNSDQTWKRVAVTTQITSSSKVPAYMRVYGSGAATGGDASFLRYALPKIEYGRMATDWNGSAGSLTTGMIAFFAGPCPAGWAEYTALRGRVAVGLNAGGTVGAAVGTALGDQGLRSITSVPAHSHTIDPPNTTSSTNGAHTHSIDPPNTGTSGVGDHRHWVSAAPIDDRNFTGTGGVNGQQHGTVADAGGYNPEYTSGAGMNSNYAGAHSHAVDIGAFDSSNAGNHTHDTNIPAFDSSTTGSPSVDVSMPYVQLTACRAL